MPQDWRDELQSVIAKRPAHPVGGAGSRFWATDTQAYYRWDGLNWFLLSLASSTLAQGTLAARPAAGAGNRVYFATDILRWYWDNGTRWVATDERLGLNILDYGVVGNGIANDATAYQLTLTTADTLNVPVFHPDNITTFLGTTELSVPSNTVWYGEGYNSLITSTASGTYAFAKNTGWGASTPASNIDVRRLRLRREVALAGTEGPYDGALQFRLVNNLNISELWLQGSMTGVHFEGCTNYGWDKLYGYRNGDCTIRINTNPSAPSAITTRAGEAESIDAGYQLLTGTALPNPSGPLGSAYLVTQDNVNLGQITSIDARFNALETGGTLQNLVVPRIISTVNTAGRSSQVLLSDYDGIQIGEVVITMNANGTCGVLSQGNGVTIQQFLSIGKITAWDRSGLTTNNLIALTVGRDTTHASIDSVASYDMAAVLCGGGGGGQDDISFGLIYALGGNKYNVTFATGTRYTVGKLYSEGAGADTTAAAADRTGVIVDNVADVLRIGELYCLSDGTANQKYGLYSNGTIIHAGRVKLEGATAQFLSTTSGKIIGGFSGTATPEAAIIASPGSTFSQDNGAAGTTFYIKETGDQANTGWKAVWTGTSDITLAAGVDFTFNTTTGTKLGTGPTEKLAFWGATAVVQPTAVADAAGGATIDAEARTALNGLLAKLRTIGIIAT